ncbi:5785_t:CDS:2 [Ambispora gerdemannii]|uniref:Holocytochrome c-type synthase n=1 Tax=Ambispora gerdemannii TaxID=144530 RepID=A0A9N9FJY2_9GLOM|nr:5785_t:CDS:2 [Ambispora gerdemannii]
MSNTLNSTTEPVCPIDHSSQSFPDKSSYTSTNSNNHKFPQQPQQPSACPVDHGSLHTNPFLNKSIDTQSTTTSTSTKNVGCTSDTIINPSNLMLINEEQTPMPGQRVILDTTREISNIPRSANDKPVANTKPENAPEEKLWVYPSEQMFFNAMKRKNWQPREEDMRVVVPIHNAVNEKAWQEILEWEKMHTEKNKCGGPKLVKFEGRATAITPKAKIFSWFGYKLPFDRHDWVIDRCGKQVTYVIDFYSGQPDLKHPENISFYLDVRPALTLEGAFDRLYRWANSLKYKLTQS